MALFYFVLSMVRSVSFDTVYSSILYNMFLQLLNFVLIGEKSHQLSICSKVYITFHHLKDIFIRFCFKTNKVLFFLSIITITQECEKQSRCVCIYLGRFMLFRNCFPPHNPSPAGKINDIVTVGYSFMVFRYK